MLLLSLTFAGTSASPKIINGQKESGYPSVVSLGVVIAGLAIIWTGERWIDPAVSLVIVAVIGWGLVAVTAAFVFSAGDGTPIRGNRDCTPRRGPPSSANKED